MAALTAGQHVRIVGTHRYSGKEGKLVKRDDPRHHDAWWVAITSNGTTYAVVAGDKYLEAATPIGGD